MVRNQQREHEGGGITHLLASRSPSQSWRRSFCTCSARLLRRPSRLFEGVVRPSAPPDTEERGTVRRLRALRVCAEEIGEEIRRPQMDLMALDPGTCKCCVVAIYLAGATLSAVLA